MVGTKGRPRRGAIALAVVATGAMALALVASPAAGRPPRPNTNPKNIIVFIGDGMGPEQVEIGRRVKGSALHIDGIPWGSLQAIVP